MFSHLSIKLLFPNKYSLKVVEEQWSAKAIDDIEATLETPILVQEEQAEALPIEAPDAMPGELDAPFEQFMNQRTRGTSRSPRILLSIQM